MIRELSEVETSLVSGGFVTVNGVNYTEDEWNSVFNVPTGTQYGNTDIFGGMLGYNSAWNSFASSSAAYAQQWSSYSSQQTAIDRAQYHAEQAASLQQTINLMSDPSQTPILSGSGGSFILTGNTQSSWSLGFETTPYLCAQQFYNANGELVRTDTYSETQHAAFNSAKLISNIPPGSTPLYQTSNYDQSLFNQHGMIFNDGNGRGWVFNTYQGGVSAIRLDFATTYPDGGRQQAHYNSGVVSLTPGSIWDLQNHSYWGSIPTRCLVIQAL